MLHDQVIPISQSEFKPYDPIKLTRPTVAEFDSDMLPEAFKAYVEDCSYRMQSPPDFIAVALMVALSALVGRKVAIHPKQLDSWLVVPNLWGAIVGRPSTMKSPTLSEALKFVAALEACAKEDFDRAMAAFSDDSVLHDLQAKNAKKDAERAVKAGEQDEAKKIIQAASKSTPQEPMRRRYKVNDSTVEKLGELLNENQNGLLVVRDEITGLLKTLDKSENAAARAFYLEGWNGDQAFTYDRIGRGTVDIEAVTLSIIGGIQPGVLKPYIAGAINGSVGDDGLLQRFQLLVYPDACKQWKYVDKAPDSAAIKRANDVFARVDSMSHASQLKVRFTSKAQPIFIEWLSELEGKLRAGNLHQAIESHLAKYRSLVPSLALLIQIADNPDKSAENVDKVSLLKACDWADYLESHAMRIYAMGIQGDSANALLISSRFDKLGGDFTRRDIQKRDWSGLKDTDAIQNALDLLVAHGYLKMADEVIQKTGGRPSLPSYAINPDAI